MKNYLLGLGVLISLNTFSQKVDYTVIKDEPVEPKLLLNLSLVDIDLNSGIQNIRTDNISINAGLWGYYKVINQLEAELDLKKSYLTAGRIGFKEYPGNFELSLGGNFFFSSVDKINPKTRVVLKSDTRRDYSEGKDYTTTTYIDIPAKKRVKMGLRGGLYYKRGPFNYGNYSEDPDNNTITLGGVEETSISSFGIYAGIMRRSLRNIVITDKKYGKSKNSGGTDLILDVLFVPVNTFRDLRADIPDSERNVTQEVKDFDGPGGSNSPLGFRIGYKVYPVEQKKITGKKFGISGTFYMGYKPFQGWFVQGGFGVNIVKAKSLTKNVE